ncbi:hypothetical protein LTR85_000985 [Meristemomyces frigidus]|nr:hypothetical protein LTR85_000985 [Meristemomyces frigidus]
MGELLEMWLKACDSALTGSRESCFCVPWLSKRLEGGFMIPSHDCSFDYQDYLPCDVECCLTSDVRGAAALNAAEQRVVRLYRILLRPFNNEPSALTSEWTDFGFCYCTSSSQRQSLASAYIQLADGRASLSQITSNWERSSLESLMKEKGVDIADLEANSIDFHRPQSETFGIYRLMAEVQHALSGCWCPCFRPACASHSKQESILSRESEGDYGFHGANAWERWQLFNFYSRVFAHPAFDPRAMQESRRDADPKALERYLHGLLPDFRRKIGNMHVADAMFPKLGARVSFPNGRPHCYCVAHTMLMSEGLDATCFDRIKLLTGESGDALADDETDDS